MQQADYIIIGGGSAGCVTAARLIEANAGSVVLLEAGDPAENHPETLSADGFKDAFANDALMWHRMTPSQNGCGKRSLYAGTGRGMGGSGSVNGMVYTRGDTRDYANWPQGWQWRDVVPAFEAVEQQLSVQPCPATPFAERFIAAAQASGLRRQDGMNNGDLGGIVGCNDINYAGDKRCSSWSAWLKQLRSSRLQIVTAALVERVIFDGETAIAVAYRHNGQQQRVAINREVIFCAGALETPKLLMLSGVGPRDHLQAFGIATVLDAPAVGQHLHDHPNVCMFYRAKQRVDFNYPQIYAFDKVTHSDTAAANQAPDTCFVCYAAPASLQQTMRRMLPILALPGRLHDVKALRTGLRKLIDFAFRLPPLQRFVSRIFGIVVILGKPVSRGTLRLASPEPGAPAQVDPAYYSDPTDRETMLAAVARARDIAAQSPLANAKPLSAAAKTSRERKVWKWVTAATMTTFHFCGSCRMGTDDASPVDTQLRLKGLTNVRVADASVMPETPVSALNAPSMMIGYRAAEFALATQQHDEDHAA